MAAVGTFNAIVTFRYAERNYYKGNINKKHI